MDALHYALLAVLVLLVFYAASTYGVFKEGGSPPLSPEMHNGKEVVYKH